MAARGRSGLTVAVGDGDDVGNGAQLVGSDAVLSAVPRECEWGARSTNSRQVRSGSSSARGEHRAVGTPSAYGEAIHEECEVVGTRFEIATLDPMRNFDGQFVRGGRPIDVM